MNHGTAPDEKNTVGELMLDVVKVYHFTGKKEDLENLEQAYIDAICDTENGKPLNTFLSMVEGKSELEKVVLESLGGFITANNNFTHGNLTKEAVLQIIASGDVAKLMPLLQGSSLTEIQIISAFNTILRNSFVKLGNDLSNFHVCNNDADLQVKLIKNFISTGKTQIPERKCTGPMIYYYPI